MHVMAYIETFTKRKRNCNVGLLVKLQGGVKVSRIKRKYLICPNKHQMLLLSLCNVVSFTFGVE